MPVSFLAESQVFTYSGTLLNHIGLSYFCKITSKKQVQKQLLFPLCDLWPPLNFFKPVTLRCIACCLSVCLILCFVLFFASPILVLACFISPCQTRANTLYDHVRRLIIASSQLMKENLPCWYNEHYEEQVDEFAKVFQVSGTKIYERNSEFCT